MNLDVSMISKRQLMRASAPIALTIRAGYFNFQTFTLLVLAVVC